MSQRVRQRDSNSRAEPDHGNSLGNTTLGNRKSENSSKALGGINNAQLQNAGQQCQQDQQLGNATAGTEIWQLPTRQRSQQRSAAQQ
jgi:hypothetical protein